MLVLGECNSVTSQKKKMSLKKRHHFNRKLFTRIPSVFEGRVPGTDPLKESRMSFVQKNPMKFIFTGFSWNFPVIHTYV